MDGSVEVTNVLLAKWGFATVSSCPLFRESTIKSPHTGVMRLGKCVNTSLIEL